MAETLCVIWVAICVFLYIRLGKFAGGMEQNRRDIFDQEREKNNGVCVE